FRSELLNEEAARDQFLQEMEAMAEMNHPNVVQFLDVDQANDTFYCAMEYIEGTDLGKIARLCGQLPVAQASEFIRQTALGLQHAHEHNLVHRDIKPVNLYLTALSLSDRTFALDGSALPGATSGGAIKILDWGLATLRFPKNHPMQAQRV